MAASTDRRTRYTRMVLKDAFLELIGKGGWRRLSVTLLCKKAGVARATFYLHYRSLDDVLSDVLDDAFRVREGDGETLCTQLARTLAAGPLTEESFLPLCQRAADDPKYRPLFLDEDLTRPLLAFLYDRAKDPMVPYIMTAAGLSRGEAELLFRFLLCGSFAVNAALGWEQNDRWRAVQGTVLRFKAGGLAALKRK